MNPSRPPCRGPHAHLWDHTLDQPETPTARTRRLHTAVSHCHRCTTRSACLQARTIHDWGVWGGELFEAGRLAPVDLPPAPINRPPPPDPATLSTRDCHWCGHGYEPRSGRSRYCDACRPEARRENHRRGMTRYRARKAQQDQEVAA